MLVFIQNEELERGLRERERALHDGMHKMQAMASTVTQREHQVRSSIKQHEVQHARLERADDELIAKRLSLAGARRQFLDQCANQITPDGTGSRQTSQPNPQSGKVLRHDVGLTEQSRLMSPWISTFAAKLNETAGVRSDRTQQLSPADAELVAARNLLETTRSMLTTGAMSGRGRFFDHEGIYLSKTTR